MLLTLNPVFWSCWWLQSDKRDRRILNAFLRAKNPVLGSKQYMVYGRPSHFTGIQAEWLFKKHIITYNHI